MQLLYLAKPIYGGWVTFSANLAKINNTFIVKLGKRTETTRDINKIKIPKFREYGYGIKYRNFLLSDLLSLYPNDDILITAIDKNYHHYLDKLPLEKVTLIIHDPTEIKKCILPYLPKMKKIITIRQLVNQYLNKMEISNEFIIHPFIEQKITIDRDRKTGAVSVSRIDWDKHTDILLECNKLLDNNKIDIYGDKNDIFVYNKLRKLDSMKEDDINSNYHGRFPKDNDFLSNILIPKKFMIDLSRIKNDGGGTQYTFLEAINHECCLILHKDWVNVPGSIWKDGVNCLAINTEIELKEILDNNLSCQHIIENANKLL